MSHSRLDEVQVNGKLPLSHARTPSEQCRCKVRGVGTLNATGGKTHAGLQPSLCCVWGHPATLGLDDQITQY